jgi:hypothetical protein
VDGVSIVVELASMSIEGNPAENYDDEENWHISRGKNRSGPFRLSDLVAGVDQQLIKATDFVWRHKWADWRQVKSVPGLASLTGLSEYEQKNLRFRYRICSDCVESKK